MVPPGYTPTNNGQRSDNTSGYRGVTKKTKYGYRAQIKIKGKSTHLGTFKTRKQAAIAYDHAVLKYNKPIGKLNFPPQTTNNEIEIKEAKKEEPKGITRELMFL